MLKSIIKNNSSKGEWFNFSWKSREGSKER